MIYTRWGDEVTIVENNGTDKYAGLGATATLVKIRFPEGETRHYFADFMKADGGWQEIHDAVSKSPCVFLAGKELKDALREAL